MTRDEWSRSPVPIGAGPRRGGTLARHHVMSESPITELQQLRAIKLTLVMAREGYDIDKSLGDAVITEAVAKLDKRITELRMEGVSQP